MRNHLSDVFGLSNQAFSNYLQSPWGTWNGWVLFQWDRRERKKILTLLIRYLHMHTHTWVHKALSWPCMKGSHKCVSRSEHAWACMSVARCVHEHAIVHALVDCDKSCMMHHKNMRWSECCSLYGTIAHKKPPLKANLILISICNKAGPYNYLPHVLKLKSHFDQLSHQCQRTQTQLCVHAIIVISQKLDFNMTLPSLYKINRFFSNDSYDSKPSLVHTGPLTRTHTAPRALSRKVMVMIHTDRLRPLRT